MQQLANMFHQTLLLFNLCILGFIRGQVCSLINILSFIFYSINVVV